jgi:putative lipoprotein
MLFERTLAAAVTVWAAACTQAPAIENRWLSFRCPDGQTVLARFEPNDDFVNVRFGDRQYRLPHAMSGSGARYSDGVTTFWNKGRSALIQVGDRIVVQDCMQE